LKVGESAINAVDPRRGFLVLTRPALAEQSAKRRNTFLLISLRRIGTRRTRQHDRNPVSR